MRISILTTGRFHVCDLARELAHQGHDIAFYSCVPRSRTRQFGLPDQCAHSLFPILAPIFYAMRKAQSTRLRHIAEQTLIECLDRLTARLLKHCDVFIGMSGMSIRTARAARRQYDTKVWIERGSQHILAQKQILESMPESPRRTSPVADYSVRRELAEYEMADTIVVPALHVERSFLARGTAPSRLFRNPYGVDLEMFPPTMAPPSAPPTVLMVGAWSLRKGCDVLVSAWQSLPDVRLVHIGSVVDLPLPDGPLFQHVDPVPQARLKDYYAQAHVAVLASREEGLAVVQPQAIACGLPLVCTERTGGEDLRPLFDNPSLLTVVPPDNAPALREALRQALNRARHSSGLRNILGISRTKLSWRAYGERYHLELRQRITHHP